MPFSGSALEVPAFGLSVDTAFVAGRVGDQDSSECCVSLQSPHFDSYTQLESDILVFYVVPIKLSISGFARPLINLTPPTRRSVLAFIGFAQYVSSRHDSGGAVPCNGICFAN